VVESKAPRWMAVLAAREMPFAEVPVTMGNEQTACELREEQLGVGLSTFESLSVKLRGRISGLIPQHISNGTLTAVEMHATAGFAQKVVNPCPI
jgi:hypothetical protein